MRYILLFCTTLLLSGCFGDLFVKPDFPEAPEALMGKCSNLATIDKPKVVLSEFMKTVTSNYTKYHDCSDLVSAWQEWYTEQKKNAAK